MSEIKGQLLGIIMVLVIFGAVSVTIATLFSTSNEKIVEKSTNLTKPFEDELASSLLTYQSNLD